MTDEAAMIICQKGLCCQCLGSLELEIHVNVVPLNKQAQWPAPVWGREDVGITNGAVGILCMKCSQSLDPPPSPILAVEFGPDYFVRYYAVKNLPSLPEPPRIIVPGNNGLMGSGGVGHEPGQ
jgi:hypothetical protein